MLVVWRFVIVFEDVGLELEPGAVPGVVGRVPGAGLDLDLERRT